MILLPLVDDAFLASHWHREFQSFCDSPEETALLDRLHAWNAREVLKETSSEAAFIQHFFVKTWGYVDQAFDYLQEAHNSRDRDALVTPSWTVVTDMREFRLYSRLKGKSVFQRFVLTNSNDPRSPSHTLPPFSIQHPRISTGG